MRPCFAFHYQPCLMRVNGEFASKMCKRKSTTFVKPSYFQHVCLFQLGTAMSFAMRVPILIHRILRIVFVGSKKQVLRVYAVPDIALMKNTHSVRYLAKMYCPRHAMDGMRFLDPVFHHKSVPIRGCVPNPQPTPFCFLHPAPERLGKCFSAVRSFNDSVHVKQVSFQNKERSIPKWS